MHSNFKIDTLKDDFKLTLQFKSEKYTTCSLAHILLHNQELT